MNRSKSIPAFMLTAIPAPVSPQRALPLGTSPWAGARGTPVVSTYDGSPYLGAIRNTVLYGEVWERATTLEAGPEHDHDSSTPGPLP